LNQGGVSVRAGRLRGKYIGRRHDKHERHHRCIDYPVLPVEMASPLRPSLFPKVAFHRIEPPDGDGWLHEVTLPEGRDPPTAWLCHAW
jgi:hypothetical protein